MIRALALLLLAAAPAAAEIPLPSGLTVTPQDSRIEEQPDGEVWLVLRYLAPSIAGGAVAYDDVIGDLEHLCAAEGIAAAARVSTAIDQVLVVLMDRVIPRGETVPEATQFIGAWRIGNGRCRWE